MNMIELLLWVCNVCGKEEMDCYMVHDEVWRAAGFRKDNHAHLECLELRVKERLKRQLTIEDFTDVPGNNQIHFGYEMKEREVSHYVWTAEDDERVSKMYRELFGGDK